jgi:hypothetical protein
VPCLAPGLGTGPGNRGNPPFENIRHYFLDRGGDSLLAHRRSRPALPRALAAAKSEALSELRTVSEDPEWLETMVAHLPERR